MILGFQNESNIGRQMVPFLVFAARARVRVPFRAVVASIRTFFGVVRAVVTLQIVFVLESSCACRFIDIEEMSGSR